MLLQYILLVGLGCVYGLNTEVERSLSRWRRQSIHCQPNDASCKRCSGSCRSIDQAFLPECCEAYNACCDDYFDICQQCTNVASIDPFFPEFCCASFTKCCEQITTFPGDVKAPVPVRTKPKSDLKIPQVAAPKPDSFPGTSGSVNAVPAAAASPVAPLNNQNVQAQTGAQRTSQRRRPQNSQSATDNASRRRNRVSSRGRVSS